VYCICVWHLNVLSAPVDAYACAKWHAVLFADNVQVENVVKQKFQYVVACQVFGRMKKNQDPKADDIERLLKRFPNLRVAYIDEVTTTTFILTMHCKNKCKLCVCILYTTL
jgi:hypothetical protein